MLRSTCFAFALTVLSSLVTAREASAQTFEESVSPVAAAPPVDGRAAVPQEASEVARVSSEPLADQVKPEERAWYGAAILGTDAAALGLGVLGLSLLGSRDSQELGAAVAIGGGLTYLAGGPIVHAAHGNVGSAFGSLGLRVGVPIAGAYIGAALGSAKHCSDESCQWDGLAGGVLGFGLGMLAASIIDISALSYQSNSESAAPRVALVPNIDPKRAGAGLDLVGLW